MGSPIRVALLVAAIVAAINFVTMPAQEYTGDAHAVRTEAVLLTNTGKWAVPADVAEPFGPRGEYFFQNANGNWYPKYGIFNTLMYLPPLSLEKIATSSLEIDSPNRVFYLDLFNVALSAVTAFYLILLSRRYTKSNAIASIFVFASIYSTFWWNYLRAQTFETYHTLFLVAFFYHFVSALDRSDQTRASRRNGYFLAASICFGALVLSKSVYVVLLLPIAFMIGRSTSSILADKRKAEIVRHALWFWLPILIALCILAATNWYKFGSPLATGYTQWQEERHLFALKNILPALGGFLFSAHFSVFIHYPLLFFAIAGWPIFLRKNGVDAIAASLFGVAIVLANAMFINWSGESSYGPRYLLPILPILSLPFINFLEWLRRLPRSGKLILSSATAFALIYFALLQACVATLPFFFPYALKDTLDKVGPSNPMDYLRSRAFGAINRDFLLYRTGHRSPFTSGFLDQLNVNEVQRFSALNESLRANYYWFPNLLE